MLSQLSLPDWLPWWVPIALLVPALLYGLLFLYMPFGVMGLKGRLEAIEARLDEIQGEIRSLALRMPEPLPRAHFDEAYAPPPPEAPVRRSEVPSVRPPIPPARRETYDDPPPEPYRAPPRPSVAEPGETGPRTVGRPVRNEPRLDRPW
jgi:hypothetical protein